MATQHRLEARLEVVVIRPAGNQFVGQTLVLRPLVVMIAEQPHERPHAVEFDALVMLQRSIQCIGQKPQSGQGECP